MQSKKLSTGVSVLIILVTCVLGYFIAHYRPQQATQAPVISVEYPLAPYEEVVTVPEDMAMVDFFGALEQKDYDRAISLFDGPYDGLRNWNPTVSYYDLGTLWKNGCEGNGLNCLKIKKILSKEVLDPSYLHDETGGWGDRENIYTVVYKYKVTYQNEDGTLFEIGPCCGMEDGTRTSEFDVIVGKKSDGYFVLSYPPYNS